MTVKPIVLKVLLQQRHLQTHSAFRREYDKVAAGIDPTLRGGGPSKAQFYRWISGELIGLPYADHCRILEGMTWQVRHDRDAFKELWLLFENDEARFPLYPGESTEIVYSYTVSDIKWGQWFQRAVRLPPGA